MEIRYSTRICERFLTFLSVAAFISTILSFIKPEPAVYFFLGISEIAFVVLLEIFMTKETKIFTHVVFLLFSEALNIGLCFAALGYIIPLIPIGVLVEFLFTLFIINPYIYHDYFEEQVENKKGPNLKNELLKDRFISEDFCQKTIKFKNTMLIMSVGFIIILFILKIAKFNFNLMTYISALTFLLSVFLHFQLLTHYHKEVYFSFLGKEDIFEYRGKYFWGALLILAASSLLGFLFSSNFAILKPQYFKWLLRFFGPTDIKTGPAKPEPIEPINPMPDLSGLLSQLDKGDGKESIAGPIITIVFIALTVFIFGYCIFQKVSTYRWGDMAPKRKIHDFLKRVKEGLIDIFKRIFSFRYKKASYAATTTSSDFKNTINDFIKFSKKSKQKKAELDRLTSIFMKLIDWGNSKGIKYTQNLAPAEYSQKLELQTALDAAHIFEKALYSDKLLTADEEKLFKEYIEQIINS